MKSLLRGEGRSGPVEDKEPKYAPKGYYVFGDHLGGTLGERPPLRAPFLWYALNILASRFAKHDRARCAQAMEEITQLWRACGNDLEKLKLYGGNLLQERRKYTGPPDRTTAGLLMIFDWIYLRIKDVPRAEWMQGILDALATFPLAPVTLSVYKQDRLREDLATKRTPRGATLAALHRAGYGNPENVSSRLQRAGHRITKRPRP